MDSALGVVNIVTIPIVLSISMILCVTIFVNRKLVRPIKLLTNAYRKVENNELDFTLPYPYKDEMGRLCLAFEKMKNCLYQNNQERLEKLMIDTQKQLDVIERKMLIGDNRRQLIEQYTNLEHLDRETVEKLIDYVLVGKKDPVTKEVPIEIHWNF